MPLSERAINVLRCDVKGGHCLTNECEEFARLRQRNYNLLASGEPGQSFFVTFLAEQESKN